MTDGMWKLGYSSTWESRSMEASTTTCFCHNSYCLSYVRYVAILHTFQRKSAQHKGHTMFSDINSSQGSVVTRLRCGGTFN